LVKDAVDAIIDEPVGQSQNTISVFWRVVAVADKDGPLLESVDSPLASPN
jgi:hypothetical protein